MTIDDAIRQLSEARSLYGDLPVKVKHRCAHTFGVGHRAECYDDASVEVSETGWDEHMRMVVIS